MSTQSITTLSKDKYIQEAQEILSYNIEQYFYHKNFRLSGGMNEEEATHNRYLLELLCENNCDVYNSLYDKIAGVERYKHKKKKPISYIAQELEDEDETPVDVRNFWSDVQW